MSNPPSETDVIEMVKWLEQMPGEKEMRERSEHFHELVSMQLQTDLPEHVSRGKTRDIPLGDLLDMAYGMQAERHSYQTTVQLTALDGTPQTVVDRIEKACAIRTAQHLRKWNVQDEAGFHQLLSYAGIITWHCDDKTSPQLTRIETPDIFSCYFPVKGAGRPAAFAQRFRVLLNEVEGKFTNGMRDGNAPYMKADGTWSRYRMSDDRPALGGTMASTVTGSSRFATDTEIVRLDADGWLTVMALNRGATTPQNMHGQILWQDKSRACPDEEGNECAAAIIVPGFVTPMRKPRDRLMPAFIPGIQAVNALFFLTSIMASKAENSTGDVLLEQSPEQIRAAGAAGMTAVTVAELEQGNPSVVPVPGKPVLWERLPEPYLMKLLDFWSARYDRWANSLREIADPALLAAINTNVYLPHAAARRKLMGPMLDQTDAAMKELLRMDLYALQYYGAKEVTYTSSGGERYGAKSQELTRGEVVKVTWDDVKDFDKRFVLSVSTNSMSEDEQRQRLLAHEEKVQMGYATKRQGISVAGFPDEEAQIEELAIDEVYKADTQLLAPQLPSTIAAAVRLAGGMVLTIEGPVQTPPPSTPAGPGTVTYQTPVVPGGSGQSQPAVQ